MSIEKMIINKLVVTCGSMHEKNHSLELFEISKQAVDKELNFHIKNEQCVLKKERGKTYCRK